QQASQLIRGAIPMHRIRCFDGLLVLYKPESNGVSTAQHWEQHQNNKSTGFFGESEIGPSQRLQSTPPMHYLGEQMRKKPCLDDFNLMNSSEFRVKNEVQSRRGVPADVPSS